MPQENVEVAVLFADVTGSTRLYDTLGNEVANRAIGKALDIMRKLTAMHDGHVIKTIGDEIMCRFPTADAACTVAKQIMEELDAGLQDEEVKIHFNVGFEYGPAILAEDGDVFGDAVNVAARMMDIAGSDQIMTTQNTVEFLSQELAESTRLFDKAAVKGKAEAMTIFQVIWENEDLTRIEMTDAPQADEVRYLELEFNGEQTRISSEENRTFVLGRGVQSDLVINARLASRTHARIEFQRGKFQLTDQSSNGTFIKTDDGENIFLRRQGLMLWGSGKISLGEEVSESSPDLISFHCE